MSMIEIISLEAPQDKFNFANQITAYFCHSEFPSVSVHAHIIYVVTETELCHTLQQQSPEA